MSFGHQCNYYQYKWYMHISRGVSYRDIGTVYAENRRYFVDSIRSRNPWKHNGRDSPRSLRNLYTVLCDWSQKLRQLGKQKQVRGCEASSEMRYILE